MQVEAARTDSAAPAGVTDPDPGTGLTESEAQRRIAQYGENILSEEHVGIARRLLGFLWGPIPWMIEIAAILSAALDHWDDLAVIVLMLLINAAVGFWQEYKADTAIEALKQRLALSARVKRDGAWREIPARLLVPGDLVAIRIGNIVPADVTLVAGEYLSVDQSALTGESLPVDKKRGDSAYSGSIARQGEMSAVVTATGMRTYFGRTAKLVEQAGAVSHFQRAVLRIGNFLILTTAALVVVIVIAGLFRHNALLEMVQFALILAVASIPVALPAVLSVTLAVGAERLARLKAIVSRLVAIEELAGMDTLCSDKTGTLTRNELTLGAAAAAPGFSIAQLLEAAALASQREAPDAIDAAILAAGPSAQALTGYRLRAFRPFDPVAKRTEAEFERDGRTVKVTKGAPQVIVELCAPDPQQRAAILAEVDQAAAKGYRTLAVARDEGAGWRYLGLLPLFDPPRADSAATVRATRAMGIDIKMVTGDHEAIARQIAGELDLGRNIVVADAVFGEHAPPQALDQVLTADGFARVFPEHKFQIVKALQASGRIVGMTGDGVNDAPALKQADVGIAVSGATDAARAAAALILTAPGLSVITTAIEEARRIFARMTSYGTYRIAETIRLILFMTASILIYNFYPVTTVMVVLLALLNDIPIMMIAYDHARVARGPVRWDMPRVLTVACALGLYGVFESFVLYWIARDLLHVAGPMLQAVIFLKLLVSGHMTIYLTRNRGWVWQRPWPSWMLLVPCELTQLAGTLIVVYGVAMTPIGWGLALFVWAYTLVSFLVANAVKVATHGLLDQRMGSHARHLRRVEGPLAAPAREVPRR
jgi:H+-transporting ATPase